MTAAWTVPGWVVIATLAVLVILLAGLVVAVVRSRAHTRRALEAARRDVDVLRAQVVAIEQRLSTRRASTAEAADPREYVITRLGDEEPATGPVEPEQPEAPLVSAPLFADLVLREGAVHATTLAAGLRRALSPETRHRIRLEMRREVKRARKQRRADLREARRQWESRQRSASGAGSSATGGSAA